MNVNQSEASQPTLEQLDGWCEQALSAASGEARTSAEGRLRYYFPTFSESAAELSGAFSSGSERVLEVFPTIKGPAEAAQLMTWFLHQSSKVLSQSYVVRRLRVLVLNHLGVLADEQKEALRASLLEAVREKGAEMPGFLVDDITRTLALVVMFTWFDLEASREVVDQVLAGAVPQELGLRMLRAFVEEFNRELPARYIARQRRVVVAFRDKQLRAIFEHALAAMRAATPAAAGADTAEQRRQLSAALLLQRECLGFDFIGLAPDEASDDAVAIQIPSSWKDVVQTDGFLDAYFDGYVRSAPPVSSQFIEVLVQVASIRRSFYMEAVRVQFVRRMARGLADVLSGAVGLDDVENYHHLCRLLARFRCIHTLVEIEDASEYRDLLAAVAAFTMTGLTLWEWSPNSIAPLLAFWAKVAATHDARDDANAAVAGDVIADALPRVVREFLRAMVAATARAGSDGDDSPLDSTDVVLENVASVAAIARASYERCALVVLETLREMAGEYQDMLRGGRDVAVVERQLAWPVYAVAACLGARQPYRSLPEDDRRDAEMFATVLELDRLVQQRIQGAVGAAPSEALELALLHAHVAFRSSYIGESGHKVTAVFARLSALVGLQDAPGVLDLILQKVLFNLRTWPPGSAVVQRSLQLFHDMTVGYVSVRSVAKLETVTLLLANHSSDELQFLRAVDAYKQRALYYGGLARVLFAADAAPQFAEFMRPWGAAVDAMLAMPEEQLAQDAALRLRLVRVLRDLRGFLAAVASKANFVRFFEWLMPARIELVHRAVRMAHDVPVQIAALKLLAEFVYNRTQRLNFDVSSANGILMFREASRAVFEYGRLAMGTRAVRDVYKERYKGVAVCFTMLMRLIAGKYVAIGVMPLYGDVALEQAYRTVLELLRQFPVQDVIAYPKLGKAALAMLEVLLARANVDLVPLDAPTYERLMLLCVEAFDHAETAVSSAACSVIDGLLTAAIDGADTGHSAALVELVHSRPDITQHLLRTMLNIVLFEDRPNDWSFSRPLFCLMVLHREYALQYTGQVVQYQPPERRDDLVAALKDLLASTELVLTTANRDAFTQALTQYRRQVTAKNLNLMVPSSQTLGAPVDIMKHEAQEAMDE